MGAPEHEVWLTAVAQATRSPALANCLLGMTQFVERPSAAAAQRIVCLLDCAAEDTHSDAATQAICALLARLWLYGPESACGEVLRPRRVSTEPRRA